MKARLFGALCTTLIISFLWIITASGQSDITVSNASATFTAGFGTLDVGLISDLEQVGERLFVDYSSASVVGTLVNASAEMRVALGKVTPRLSADYASASHTATLAFPKALVNDQVAPQLVGSITTLASSTANAIILRWQINEFAKSTLQYGNSSGSYSQTINVESYETNSSVEIGNLTPNTTYFGRITLTDLSGNQGQSAEFTFSLEPSDGKPLVLIYAVLDNNLGSDDETQWQRLIENVERGAANNAITVRLLIDSPGTNNAYVYEVTGGAPCITTNTNDPTCGGRYVENTNFWRVPEDTAHPKSLHDFVNDAITAHSDAAKIILSLVGHGSGWTANALPSQPSSWGEQPSRSGANNERLGGLLWDDTPGDASGTQSMSTKQLGIALQWINNATGRKIDLLYLDACSMGMAEVADEIAPYVDYLLASPNTAWATFPYDRLLGEVTGNKSAKEIGEAWLAVEKAILTQGNGYPHTLALYQLNQMDGLTTAVNALVGELTATVNGQRELVEAALDALERYESDYNGEISKSGDHYGDLGSFLHELQTRATGNQPLLIAVTNAQTAIANLTVGTPAFGSGHPAPYPDQQWEWQHATGLGLYFPRANDPKRYLYTSNNLRWVQRSGWDRFLDTMGMVVAANVAGTELPTCASTTGCSSLPEQLPIQTGVEIYLPIVTR